MESDKQERIRARAHAIWQSQGEPEGAQDSNWEQAERELAAEENVGTTDNLQDTELTPTLPRSTIRSRRTWSSPAACCRIWSRVRSTRPTRMSSPISAAGSWIRWGTSATSSVRRAGGDTGDVRPRLDAAHPSARAQISLPSTMGAFQVSGRMGRARTGWTTAPLRSGSAPTPWSMAARRWSMTRIYRWRTRARSAPPCGPRAPG